MQKLLKIILILLFFTNKAQADSIFTSSSKPYFKVTTLDGQEFDLEKLHGKIVIISFWASWCTNCLSKLNELENLYQKYHDKNLEIIAVNFDKLENDKSIASKITKNFNYKIAKLSEAQTNLGEPSTLPFNYVIDKNGDIIEEQSLTKISDRF